MVQSDCPRALFKIAPASTSVGVQYANMDFEKNINIFHVYAICQKSFSWSFL